MESSLLSAATLAEKTGRTLASDDGDVVMGTANCVFLYAAPFRFPNSSCGFLFSAELEVDRRDDGTSSPFDSGGLVHHIEFPNAFGTAAEFLWQHEFPIPEHRKYLQLSIENLFHSPEDYVEGIAPSWAGCLGLTGGDLRMWTHEVRLPGRVPVRGRHLEAVFAHRSLVASDLRVQELFQWCAIASVDRIAYDGPGDGDFQTLQRECISYMKRKLY